SPPDWQVAAAAPSEGTRTVPISTARASPRDSHLTSDPSGRLGVTPLFVEATDLLPQSTPTPAVWHDDDRPLAWRSDEVSNRIRQSGHSGLLERSHPVRIDFRSSRRPNLPPRDNACAPPGCGRHHSRRLRSGVPLPEPIRHHLSQRSPLAERDRSECDRRLPKSKTPEPNSLPSSDAYRIRDRFGRPDLCFGCGCDDLRRAIAACIR